MWEDTQNLNKQLKQKLEEGREMGSLKKNKELMS
jgi:hypothetical protein